MTSGKKDYFDKKNNELIKISKIYLHIFVASLFLYFASYWINMVGIENFLQLILPLLSFRDIIAFGFIFFPVLFIALIFLNLAESLFYKKTDSLIINIFQWLAIFCLLVLVFFRPIGIWLIALLGLTFITTVLITIFDKEMRFIQFHGKVFQYLIFGFLLLSPIYGYHSSTVRMKDTSNLVTIHNQHFLGIIGGKFVLKDGKLLNFVSEANIQIN